MTLVFFNILISEPCRMLVWVYTSHFGGEGAVSKMSGIK